MLHYSLPVMILNISADRKLLQWQENIIPASYWRSVNKLTQVNYIFITNKLSLSIININKILLMRILKGAVKKPAPFKFKSLS